MKNGPSGLELRNIQKRFGSQTALSNIDLEIRRGEFFSLLGPSGCGKSTLLRIIAGLDHADHGEILWNDTSIGGLPARERPFNMVFQKYALFPHLSVFDNVAFGLRLKKVASGEIGSRVREALELVNLSGFESRLPETLSGGQAQRVALARALVNRPSCLLLDEPLAALDQKLREHMQAELRLLQRKLGLTFIFVTHDQEEALQLSDRVAVMQNGRIEQIAEPRELYESPSTVFCARFVGRRNELAIESARSDGRHFAFDVRPGGQSRRHMRGLCPTGAGETLRRAFVRPERARLLGPSQAPTPGYNQITGEVVQILFRGARAEVVVVINDVKGGATDDALFFRVFDDVAGGACRAGERVVVEFSPDDTFLFGEADT